jgi:hypothetical protein
MAGEIATVSGQVDFFEGWRFRRAMTRLILGRRMAFWAEVVTGLLLSLPVGTVFSAIILTKAGAALSIGILLSLAVAMAGIFGFSRYIAGKMKRSLYARGIPAEVELSFSVEADGLHVASQTGKAVIFWPYLCEVDRVGNHWLLMGGGFSYPLPRRFFAKSFQEQIFVGAILARLQPLARAHSRDAEKFLAALPT